jgi:hypothetical protein
MARLLIAVAVGLAPVAAEAPAVPVAPPPRAVLPYFPTTVGAKWVRVVKGKVAKATERVEVVTAVERVTTGTVVSVGLLDADGKTYRAGKYALSDQGLNWVESLTGPLPVPWCLLKLPHRPGQTWGVGGAPGLDTSLTAHGPERVEVPAGAFDCVRVEEHDPRGLYQTQ